MNKIATQMLNQISDAVKQNPKTLAAILAGAGVAGIGGAAASSAKTDPNESKGSRRMRILRNALGAGAVGAGAVGLGALGYRELATALPEGDTDPATSIFTSPAGRGVIGGGLGAAGYFAGGKKREENAAATLYNAGKTDVPKGSAKSVLDGVMGGNDNDLKQLLEGKGPSALQSSLIAAGLDPHKYGMGDYRLSDKLPGKAQGAYRKGTKFVADTFRKIPGADKINMKPVNDVRKSVSRAAFRHPGVAGLIAGGVMAPELLSAAATVAGPVAPNPLHRE